MFSKLGLGTKIGLSIGVVLLLLVVLAGTAWQALHSAASGFTVYRALVDDTTLAAQLESDLLAMENHVNEYLVGGQQAQLQAAQDALGTMRERLQAAGGRIGRGDRAEAVQTIAAAVDRYEEAFQRVAELHSLVRQKVDAMDRIGPGLREHLATFMENAYQNENNAAAYNAGIAVEHLLLARLYARNFLVYERQDDVSRVKMEFDALQQRLFIVRFSARSDEQKERLNTFLNNLETYRATFADVVERVNERNALLKESLGTIGPQIASQVAGIKRSVSERQQALGPRLEAANDRATAMILGLSVAGLVAGFLFVLLITRSITRPFREIFRGLRSFSTAELASVRTEFRELAERLSNGGEQVSASSTQIASGASEQASSLEETSASLEELASMTRQNADHAREADGMVQDVQSRVEAADRSMDELTGSFAEIARANEETSRIVKSINEISFQTNLLALNAAVEAARAGEAGRGFAVVAEEVRNLASRAAEAAQETAGLIESTVQRVKRGNDLVTSTNTAFKAVSTTAPRVAGLISQITSASQEQSRGLEQVNQAVFEMDKVVQANASATEELSSQAEELNDMVRTLMQVLDGDHGSTPMLEAGRAPQALDWEQGGTGEASGDEVETRPGNGQAAHPRQPLPPMPRPATAAQARHPEAPKPGTAAPEELDDDSLWREQWR